MTNLDGLVFVDVETTGVDPMKDEVIEVALVDLDGHSEEFSLSFNESRANSEALEINGWGKRPFPPRYFDSQASETLLRWFGYVDVVPDGEDFPSTKSSLDWERKEKIGLVAKHAHFDAGFLSAFLGRAGCFMTAPWTKHVYDLPSLICGRLGISPVLYNSESAEQFFGIIPERDENGYHTALSDAEWNQKVFHALRLWGSL
jgi:hypothetical protein